MGVMGVLVGGARADCTTDAANSCKDLVTTLALRGNYTRILYLLSEAHSGLLTQLLAAPKITLFLPTDAAMGRVDVQTINDLQQHPDDLKAVLQYHAVMGYGAGTPINNGSNDLLLNSVEGPLIRVNYYPEKRYTYTAQGVEIT